MAKSRETKIELTAYDDLFETDQSREEAALSKIRDIPIAEIDEFPDHPFKVLMDEDMEQLVDSIKRSGVMTPATVRLKEDGRYELISGHRRKKACELAGLETLKCEVKELTRDEAIIVMVESNLQRSAILPSEKAFAYPEVTTIDTFYTTADGELITPQTLEYGTGYSLVEVQAPYGYVLNSEPVYFDVVQENSEEESGITVIEVVRSNMAQKGTVTVSKSGEVFSSVAGDKGFYHPLFAVAGLEGAVYEITAAEDIYTLDGTLRASKGEVVDTVTTGADGTAKSKELYLGRYEVKEITAPYGMVLNEEVHGVELVYAGQNIAVTETATGFVNERQRVEIDLVKSLETNEAYGIGKNGEIFDVTFGLYTNGDGKLDKDDVLLGTMTELEGGVYQMKELRYGKYLVREKTAPTGFVLDENVYAVSIEENGKTYTVENKAGVGFINTAQKGSLKIVKTSSDGKVEGFSFRVTGVNYDQTFTTDKNGEILIENLRIGEYTVSEVNDKASAGYILPADKQAAVQVGATTIVQMHNELRDTPKTGDDFNAALWVSLAAVLTVGAGVVGFLGIKGKKKKED